MLSAVRCNALTVSIQPTRALSRILETSRLRALQHSCKLVHMSCHGQSAIQSSCSQTVWCYPSQLTSHQPVGSPLLCHHPGQPLQHPKARTCPKQLTQVEHAHSRYFVHALTSTVHSARSALLDLRVTAAAVQQTQQQTHTLHCGSCWQQSCCSCTVDTHAAASGQRFD